MSGYTDIYEDVYRGDGGVPPGDGNLWTFTPPTYDVIPPIHDDWPPLSNRLMRFFQARPAGRNIWQLMDDSLTFDQPYPTVEDTPQNRAEGPPGQYGARWSNLTPTYKRVYWGGHTYTLESSPDGTEIIRIAVFLIDNGYTPTDWLIAQAAEAAQAGYSAGYIGKYG